jgi:hypothetical protein
MWCGTWLKTKPYDKIIKRPSKSHETIPLSAETITVIYSTVKMLFYEDECFGILVHIVA